MKCKTKALFAALAVLVVVGIEPAIASPIAVISGPYQILPGQTITLNGAGSYDTTPGAVLSYAWDLDANGIFNDAVSATATFTAGNTALYGQSFPVFLRVTDNFGATATTGSTVTVVKELPAAVPEPFSTALFAIGALAFSAARRTKRRN